MPADPNSRFAPQLHGLWDGEMVAEAVRQTRAEAHAVGTRNVNLAGYLARHEPAGRNVTADAKVEEWSTGWANDILPNAREAHERLEIANVAVSSHNGVTTAKGFVSEKGAMLGYIKWGGGVVKDEIAKGGWRLAALLEAVVR